VADAPPIPAVLYCPHCCRRQPVALEASGSRCTVRRREGPPPGDPEACPRSPDGQHTPIHASDGWRCSRCNTPMPEPEDAGIIQLGGRR